MINDPNQFSRDEPAKHFSIPPLFSEREIREGFGVDGPLGCDYVPFDAKAMA